MNESSTAVESEVLQAARRLVLAGYGVLPIQTDGKKRPALNTWAELQERLPSTDEVREWWGNGHRFGLAMISGAVSGNVEVLDFESMEAFSEWCGMVPVILRDRLVMVRTPGGGMHVRYRCAEPIPAGRKLARGADGKLLIETRGEGHYAIIPPSPPACHPSGLPYEPVQGDLADLPVISAADRALMIEAAERLNEYQEPERPVAPRKPPAARSAGEVTPMED